MQSKPCERCGEEFTRRERLSNSQWQNRKYCSKSCAATKLSIDKDKVRSMYVDDLMSSTQIAESIGTSPTHVLRVLAKIGVKTRSATLNKTLSHSRACVREKLRNSATSRKLSEAAKDKLRALSGKKNSGYISGITLNKHGYLVFSRSSSNGDLAGKALHVCIAEWLYGRRMKKGEHVHHIDGNKLNNHPENLAILNHSDHAKLHTEDRENGKRSKSV